MNSSSTEDIVETSKSGAPRVLIVDDAATIRLYHRGLIEAAGFEAHEAANGLEALETALRLSFDLFLVDVNMPEMNGYRFLEEARRTPQLSAVPAVMISTEAKDCDREQAFAAGANLYCVKPIQPDAFADLMTLLLEGRAND
ncbi:MAG: response regulator [Pseudomonadota bacterium]